VSGVPVSGPERAIAQEIADTMNQGDGFRGASITVTSRKGEVLLEGSAPSKAQAEQAGVIAAQVAGGDVQVTNQVVGWS
jgi:osmotically-inducible protein OsmY